jgi:hypothetical protein
VRRSNLSTRGQELDPQSRTILSVGCYQAFKKHEMYEQAYIKERIDDHIKWYGAKAGQFDHIWLVRSQLTYITFQQALYSGHEWLICYGQM